MAGIEPNPFEIKGGFETSGSNQSGMRAHNERLVLTILRRYGPLPKAEIARITQLSAQTVSVITRALEADGLISRGEKLRGKIGQPSIPMQLAPEGALFFGLKVGRRSTELILVDFVGREIAHIKRTYAYPTPSGTRAFVQDAVAEMRDNLTVAQVSRIAGMGIATPFFLWEWAAMIGVEPSKMAAWRNCDLRAEIEAMFDFPVYLGNDATCACGAELVFGTADAPPDYLYFYIGYFIGGGVVLNGALFTGIRGNAGAIGPFPVQDEHGKPCQLVSVASLAGIEHRLEARNIDTAQLWRDPVFWDFDRALLDEWLDVAVPAIADAILASISVIDFPTVMIDGFLPTAIRKEITERVATRLAAMPMSGLAPPEIVCGSIGTRARAIGAASLPLSKRFLLEA